MTFPAFDESWTQVVSRELRAAHETKVPIIQADRHFRQRFRERVGLHLGYLQLEQIARTIQSYAEPGYTGEPFDVRQGLARWLFEFTDSRSWLVVYDHNTRTLVTLYEYKVMKHGHAVDPERVRRICRA